MATTLMIQLTFKGSYLATNPITPGATCQPHHPFSLLPPLAATTTPRLTCLAWRGALALAPVVTEVGLGQTSSTTRGLELGDVARTTPGTAGAAATL